ncbi:MAG TPA: hypothetical protein VF637_05920, partial [Sphingomicrobium sp.]
MRRFGLAVALGLSTLLTACVQTRQFADLEFSPPSGDYRLLVMRPDVQVSSLTAGGLAEARADWTEQARTHIITALRAQQAERGGKVQVLARRNELTGVSEETVADLERLHGAVGNSIAMHKYMGAYLPTKRRKGLEYTLGEDAVALGRKTGFDYALFMHAQENIASKGRVAMQVLGTAGCLIGICAPSGGSN